MKDFPVILQSLNKLLDLICNCYIQFQGKKNVYAHKNIRVKKLPIRFTWKMKVQKEKESQILEVPLFSAFAFIKFWGDY